MSGSTAGGGAALDASTHSPTLVRKNEGNPLLPSACGEVRSARLDKHAAAGISLPGALPSWKRFGLYLGDELVHVGEMGLADTAPVDAPLEVFEERATHSTSDAMERPRESPSLMCAPLRCSRREGGAARALPRQATSVCKPERLWRLVRSLGMGNWDGSEGPVVLSAESVRRDARLPCLLSRPVTFTEWTSGPLSLPGKNGVAAEFCSFIRTKRNCGCRQGDLRGEAAGVHTARTIPIDGGAC